MDKLNLLLIEDDEDDFVLTRDLLSEVYPEGIDLEWVSDYEKASERLCSNEHDVCLLDYRLGAHNGIQLLREVRRQGCNTPVIILTGQRDREVDYEAMRAGASDYLIKGEINAALLERSIRYSKERRRLEVERLELIREQEAREAAEKANRAKDEFLAMVSHELRSPLNAILGWTRILRSGTVDEETSERALDTIERSAKSQAQMIEDLLDISRIINGNLRLNLMEVNLPAILMRVLESMYPMANAKHVEIELETVDSVGVVMGDPDRLQQIFSNILSNAIKFTPEEGRVTIHLKKIDGCAQIIFSDTGKGIHPDFLPYVFERYRQGQNEYGRKHKGLGLGLAIVRNLIELHGGSVRAESAGEARGATFIVALPTG
jgi:signal transduction histidine kinase